jgi:hypothetical protein
MKGSALEFARTPKVSGIQCRDLCQVNLVSPLTFAGVILFLTFVALPACHLPARRAMKADPTIALRRQ